MANKNHKIYNFNIYAPKYFIKKVWERTGKNIDQRILQDFYRIILDYLTEKLILENFIKIDGFGTFVLIKNKNKTVTYPIKERKFYDFLNIRFYADDKISSIIKLFHKKWRKNAK